MKWVILNLKLGLGFSRAIKMGTYVVGLENKKKLWIDIKKRDWKIIIYKQDYNTVMVLPR